MLIRQATRSRRPRSRGHVSRASLWMGKVLVALGALGVSRSAALPAVELRAVLPFLPCRDSEQGCAGHGTCVRGSCVCELGWTGYDCRFDACPMGTPPKQRPGSALATGNCSGNGLCLAGRCACGEGFEGDDCSTVAGPGATGRPSKRTYCSGHGALMPRLGRCLCESGWQGEHW